MSPLVLTASTNQRLQLWRVPPTQEQAQLLRRANAQDFQRQLPGGEIRIVDPGSAPQAQLTGTEEE